MSHYSEVFKFTDYEDGPDVPVVLASQVGGIYRVGPGVIQVTLINQMIRDQQRFAKAVVHQLWIKTHGLIASGCSASPPSTSMTRRRFLASDC